MSTLVFVLWACIGNQEFCIPQWRGSYDSLKACRMAAYSIIAQHEEIAVACIPNEGKSI